MNSKSDPASALKNFSENRSESVFAGIVAAHGGLVFGSALRRTGDRELAEEITQSVFAILAHKASAVSRHPSLTGWLFTTTKFETAKAMRSRHRHQRKLAALARTLDGPRAEAMEAQNELLPHLDELLDGLPKHDRELLLSRFVEEKAFRDLARQTGKSEAACKMRIKRALDKLRMSLTARGATVSVATLGLVLSSELARALPITVAASLPAKALASAATMKSSGLAITHSIQFMKTVKTSTLALAVIAIGAVPIVIQGRSTNDLRRELATMREPVLQSSTQERTQSETSRSHLTPIARMLAKVTVPATGEEFLASLFKTQLEGNSDVLLKIMLPLSRASPAKIQSLIEEVEATEKFLHVKGNGLEMLLEFAGRPQEDPAKAMDRMLVDGVAAQNYERDMAEWFAKDPEAALVWFREKTANGDLVGKGLHNSPEGYLAAGLAPGLFKSDRQAALALVDEVNPLNRGKVIEALAPILAHEGRKSWPEAHRLMNSLTDRDERMRTMQSVLVFFRDRDEVLPFISQLDLSEVEISNSLGLAASGAVVPDPERIATKMAWLQEAATSNQLEEAVKLSISRMVHRKPEEVEKWVASLENGLVRDAALDGQVSALLRKRKYDQAVERAKLITDPERRDSTTDRLFKHIEVEDPEAAEKLALPKNSD